MIYVLICPSLIKVCEFGDIVQLLIHLEYYSSKSGGTKHLESIFERQVPYACPWLEELLHFNSSYNS